MKIVIWLNLGQSEIRVKQNRHIIIRVMLSNYQKKHNPLYIGYASGELPKKHHFVILLCNVGSVKT